MAQLPKSSYLLALLLSSCSITHQLEDTYEQRFSKDVATIQELQSVELKNVPIPEVSPVVAVYPLSFTDQTGQRKSNSEFALFSTAITQHPNALLIRALKHAGDGKFFRVVERVGLDNLTKERQLIRSAREQSGNEEEKKNTVDRDRKAYEAKLEELEIDKIDEILDQPMATKEDDDHF